MNQPPHDLFTVLPRLVLRSAIATLAATAVILPLTTPSVQAESTLEDNPKAIVDEMWQIVNRDFVHTTFKAEEWLQVRQDLLSRDYTSQDQAYSAIRQALRTLGDPYTRFLTPKQFEDLTAQTTGEMSGLGISLEVNPDTQTLTVVEPMANSPASAAGILQGDRILRIDDKPTSLMSLEQATELIKGEEGTDITLQLSRDSKGVFEVTLTRANVEVPVLHYSIKNEGQMKVGYMRLDEFSSHAAEQMEAAIENLETQAVEGFVLDLRGNPGGLLFASVEIARMWMETGAIVKTVDRLGGDQEYAANRTALTTLPLVVLVDNYSASASEILAGALKDSGRATIVGSRTYGKGTVQSVHSLSDGSGLAVTVSRYYPPSGIDINKKGIAPDIEIDLTGTQEQLLGLNPSLRGTLDDPQYRRAVTVLSQIRITQGSRVVVPSDLVRSP
ncbi:MAG: S41 family peptidase [Jaaginema sp. PMC 1079.18]|nr:S41 family peptidase [Jaaginema sp. PMC 1080.18]MEC4852094.1 S41 family peptidase [Jaaginema sp. PMC 1079.18]MEC4868270.1 S41 family peptidase [Jaaginema sp. PMC 1078.18]